MFYASVQNYIDYAAAATCPDAFWAVMWSIAQLQGPCRSGGADFMKLT